MPSKNKKLKTSSTALVVVAHPDDEAIFFGGLMLANPKIKWDVVCVTDGNADGQGKSRIGDFKKSCRALGVRNAECFNMPDRYDRRLDLGLLATWMPPHDRYEYIFTHGILGEYGHPHHQDVSVAVHRAYTQTKKVYSVAYNLFPEFQAELTAKQYATKQKILWKIYGSETLRFLNFLPATYVEGFIRCGLSEVEAIYQMLLTDDVPPAKKLKAYRWLHSYFVGGHYRLDKRPF